MGTSVQETTPDPTPPETPAPTEAAAPGPEAPAEPTPPKGDLPDLPPPTPDDPPEEGAPGWMTTFGDMMSLLLTFFILLFSMSTIEIEKFRIAAQSIRVGLGDSNAQLLDGASPDSPAPTDSTLILDALQQKVEQELDSIARQLENFVAENNLGENVVVSREESGVYLRIQDAAVFGSGSANIEDESLWIIEQLGDIVTTTNVPVVVSGHTDNTPIRGGAVFPTNWELSAARASGVARALVGRGHDPTEVTVEAYGEYRPIADNATPEGRTQNRRVELFYSKQTIEEMTRAAAAAADSTVADSIVADTTAAN